MAALVPLPAKRGKVRVVPQEVASDLRAQFECRVCGCTSWAKHKHKGPFSKGRQVSPVEGWFVDNARGELKIPEAEHTCNKCYDYMANTHARSDEARKRKRANDSPSRSFKTNHAKALAKVFTTKVGYTGLAKRMARWFMRVLKRAEAEAAKANADLSAAEQRAAILTIFTNLYQHTWRHYSDAPCLPECPCKQYADVDDARHAAAACAVEDDEEDADTRDARDRAFVDAEEEWAADAAIDAIEEALAAARSVNAVAALRLADGPETTGASGGSVGGGQTTSSAKASRGKRAVSSAAAKAPKKTARTTSTAARRGRAQQSQADTTRAPQQPTGHNTQQATAAKPSTRSTNFEGGLKKWTPCPDKVTRLLLPSHTSTHTLSHSHPPTHTLSQI